MRILAIETSTRAASVAVLFDGKILAESLRESPQSFSETLMPQVEEVIKVSGAFENLDAVAVNAAVLFDGKISSPRRIELADFGD